MTLLVSALVTLVLICLFLARHRLEYLKKRDDANPCMDRVNDRRSVLCDHATNTIGLLLMVAVIMVGIHTYYPNA